MLSRQRPAYDSLGIRAGNFTIRPELRESVGYDDNVLGTRSGSGSALVETNARIRADYDHSSGTANATLSVDNMRYLSRDRQSYTNWQAGLAGTYLFGRDTLAASFDHLELSQSARDLDTAQVDSPLSYRVNLFKTSYKAVFNRVFVQPGLALSSYDYDNGTVGGKIYQQGYRNRVVAMPSVTLGYELSPRRNLVLVVRDAQAGYSSAAAGAAKRDFNDLSVLAGIDYDVDGIWRYRLLAGYESRDFSSRQYKSIQAPVAEAAVIWSPTGLTTVTASFTRHVQDSADETTAAFTENAFRIRVDHELQRNILLQGYAGWAQDEYSQNQGNQSGYSLGASATWLINRNLQLIGAYDFFARRSDSGANRTVLVGQLPIGPGYNDNRFLLTLRLAL